MGCVCKASVELMALLISLHHAFCTAGPSPCQEGTALPPPLYDFFFIPYIIVKGEVRKKVIFINLTSLLSKTFKPLSSQRDIAHVLFP